eukprot:g6295.t1
MFAFSKGDKKIIMQYLENFLRLIADNNFFLPDDNFEDNGRFQCKLFKSNGIKQVAKMCATIGDDNDKGSASSGDNDDENGATGATGATGGEGTFRRRRLLTTQSKSMSQYEVGASKATLEAGNDGGEENEAEAGNDGGEENEAEANCKTIFLDLQTSLTKGFGVARDRITKKYNGIKVKLSGKGSGDIKVHTNKPGESRVATHDATFKCTEGSKICCQETKLEIMAKKQPKKNCANPEKKNDWYHCGDCVFIEGNSWEVRKCKTSRRGLLYQSGASSC